MPADTYSNNLGYLIQGTGNNNNTWGTSANNAVFQILEDAITVRLASSVTGGTLDLSASPPPAGASAARYQALTFSGTLVSNQIVQVPNIAKFWWVNNGTSGAFTLTFKTPSGSASTAIPQNSGWQLVQCNGSDSVAVFPFNTQVIRMPDGTVSLPAYSNVNETSSGWYRAGTQDWRLAINGVAVLQVTGTGASSPSIVNVLSPNALQIAGVAVSTSGQVPVGAELPYAGHTEPTGYLFEYGQAVSRSTYSTLLAAITKTCTGNTNSSTSITGLSVDLRNTGYVGAYIEGTGIPTGTTISAIGSSTTLTLSQAATATAAGISIRILPYGQGDASTTFNVPDRRGRVIAGRDDMGGSAANRLPNTLSPFTVIGTSLGATGGAEVITLDNNSLPSHTHTATTTVFISDPGHGHSYTAPVATSDEAVSSGSGIRGVTTATTGTVGTGISATASTSNSSTGVGGPHSNVQPTGIANMIIRAL